MGLDLGSLDASVAVGLVVGSLGIGVSKSGFPGVSMLHVVLFAMAFGALPSTGVLLPMLVIGDVCAIGFFGRRADWSHIRRLLPPTLVGVLVGWLMMGRLDPSGFKRLVGGIILLLAAVQAARMWQPKRFETLPRQRGFGWTLGLLAGVTTMLANAAGPVVALYLLAVALPKWELIGTSAWLFLVLNLSKLPLSYQLGLIDGDTLRIGASLAPLIPLGMLGGKWMVHRVSQRWFNAILLGFTALMAARMALGT